MTLDIQSELADLRGAILVTPSFWARNFVRWILGLVIIGGVFWMQQPDRLSGQEKISAILPSVALFAAALVAMAFFRFFNGVGQIWKNNPALRRARQIQIDETCLRDIDIHSTTIYDWPTMSRLRETRLLFVLFTTQSEFLVLPKRCFAEAGQVNEFRALARRLLGKPAPAGAPPAATLPPPPEPRSDALSLQYSYLKSDLRQAHRRTYVIKFVQGSVAILMGVALAGMYWLVWWLIKRFPASPTVPTPRPLAPSHFILPGFIVAIGLFSIFFQALGGRSRRVWKRNRHIWLERTAQIDQQGVAIFTVKKNSAYPWHEIVKFVETRKGFLIYLSRTQFEILPKRAFADAEAMAGFRALARSLIHTGARGPGFAVLPVAPMAVGGDVLIVEATEKSA
jgi:hypothetical protein